MHALYIHVINVEIWLTYTHTPKANIASSKFMQIYEHKNNVRWSFELIYVDAA